MREMQRFADRPFGRLRELWPPHERPRSRRTSVARQHSGTMQFTIATYNIHKGFSQLGRRMVIHEVRERLHGLPADILFLQEVVGVHERHAGRFNDWPAKP